MNHTAEKIPTPKKPMIVTDIPCLRDPCILIENGVYYAYGTGWHCWKNETGTLASGWEDLGVVVDIPEDAETCYWAPEVHRYRGGYYMLTTYSSRKTGLRGCTVLKSESPEGPFCEISAGRVTPPEYHSIDGTLYVDESGQPWMVFVREWVSMPDQVGLMAAAKLSEDLTRFITEPVDLFRADDAPWAKHGVTDGCWMYRTGDGQLLMLWSNWDDAGYCVGIARSESGSVLGPWTQDPEVLYSKNMTGEYDGGHGMIFEDTDGQMYLSIHSPNNSGAGRPETPVFVPVCEKNGTLVWED